MANKNIRTETEFTEDVNFNEYESKKVYDCNRLIEITAVRTKVSPSEYIEKLDSERYIYKPTGEIRYFNKNRTREQSVSNLKKTFTKIRQIINYNFNGTCNEIHIVLTYKQLMFDTKRLYLDFKSFISKLKRQYPYCEYLSIAEPQSSGSWHLHILLKDCKNYNLFIESKTIEDWWGKGFIKVNRIKNIEHLQYYFSPGFSDNASPKAKEKAERLKYYPKRFNIYRKSRGIIVPKAEYMEVSQIQELVKDCELKYSAVSKVVKTDDNGKEYELNKIAKQEYKRISSVTSKNQPEVLSFGKEVDENDAY